jgi:hypothetical protein
MSINYSDYSKEEVEVKSTLIFPPDDFLYPVAWLKGNPPKGTNPNIFQYKNLEGKICFYIERKEAERGKSKKFIPYSYCEEKKEWVNKAWANNRPLFREENLINNNLPVLIVEGEKAVKFCENDQFISQNYFTVTFSGGSKAVHQTSFKSLQDREVVLFPDNDEDGIMAMHHVAKILIEEKISQKITWVNLDYIKNHIREGWDIADPLPTGYLTDNILAPGGVYLTKYDPDNYKKIWDKIQKRIDEKNVKKYSASLICNYIYLKQRNEFLDLSNFEYSDEKRMDNWYLHITKKGPKMSKVLLSDTRLIKIHSAICHAGLASGVVEIKDTSKGLAKGKYYNAYKVPDIEAVQGDCSEITNYYEWLFQDQWKIICQFISYMLKHPGEKIRWVPVVISEEGTGKGLLSEFIRSLLGFNNCKTNVKVDQLIGKHSTLLENNQLIVLNELSFVGTKSDKREVTNELKSMFADPYIVIEPKYQKQIEIPNLCNFMVFSQDENCLHLNNDNRRYVVIKIQRKKEEFVTKLNDSGLANKLFRYAHDTKMLSHLKYFFLQIEIPKEENFIHRAPDSIYTNEMIQSSRDEIAQYLDWLYDEKRGPFSRYYKRKKHWPGIVIPRELETALRSDVGTPKFTFYQLDKWLKSKCIRWPNGDYSRRIKTLSGRASVWLFEDLKFDNKHVSEMTQNEIGLMFEIYNRDEFKTEYDKACFIAQWEDKPIPSHEEFCKLSKTNTSTITINTTPIDQRWDPPF